MNITSHPADAYVYYPEMDDAYGEHWYPSGFTGYIGPMAS